ncbi:hypothetical protein QAD02_016689 [Eretmocerus hayati]|uniref:Uncharacterized protein n=1 Tax=Eretmocerus hayati TaxID=131215 RepID=A0ACC2PC65_9HYME|nr:hypothetical protein QAD02_016689 [Eretmocerus hayati]
MDDDQLKLDLYKIIGVTTTASENEIKKAYRKKALSCHPDKNPDNPKATKLFLQLSKALEVLTDKPARAAYDKIVYPRIQAKFRAEELNSKPKKFKYYPEARVEAFRQARQEALRRPMEARQEALKRLMRARQEAFRRSLEARQEVCRRLREGRQEAFRKSLEARHEEFRRLRDARQEAFRRSLEAREEAIRR